MRRRADTIADSPRPGGTPPESSVPGLAPPIGVVADQIAIAHRLHLLASTMPPRYPVTVTAGDLLALLNGFWTESRRADQAEARLTVATSITPRAAAVN